MKTPQEIKAEELVEKYLNSVEDRTQTFVLSQYTAIQCAKIAVEEIISDLDAEDNYIKYNYWQEVLECLNKM